MDMHRGRKSAYECFDARLTFRLEEMGDAIDPDEDRFLLIRRFARGYMASLKRPQDRPISTVADDEVLGGVAERIAPGVDDVCAYHLPDRCEVAMLGRQSLPEGVVLGAQALDRLLRELTPNDDGIIVDRRESDVRTLYS
jgi:hypothetical protein